MFLKLKKIFSGNFDDLLSLDNKLFHLTDVRERRSLLTSFGNKIFRLCITSETLADDLIMFYEKLCAFFLDVEWCSSSLFVSYFNRCCASSRIDLLKLLPQFKISPPLIAHRRFKKSCFNVPHLIETLITLSERYDEKDKAKIINNIILPVATYQDYAFLFRALIPTCNFNSILEHCFSSRMFRFLMDNYTNEVLSVFNERGKLLYTSLINHIDLFLKENEEIRDDCLYLLFKLVKKVSFGSNHFLRMEFWALKNVKYKPIFELLLRFIDPETQATLFKKDYLASEDYLFSSMENALVIIQNTENLWFYVKRMKDVYFLLQNHIKFPTNSHKIRVTTQSSLTKKALLWLLSNGFQFDEKSLFDYLLENDYFDLMYLVDVSKIGLSHFYPKFRLLS
jgi:hypothetical protein